MKKVLVAIPCAVILFAASCTYLDKWVVHDPFPGMKATLQASQGKMDVLIVHGMGQAMDYGGEPRGGYSLTLQDSLVRKLDGRWTVGSAEARPIKQASVMVGELRIRRYTSDDGRSITFYELTWAHAVKRAKVALLELDEQDGFRERSPHEAWRAPLNSSAKVFINSRLADALIYAGDFGKTLRFVAQQAICHMTRVSPAQAELCQFSSPHRDLTTVTIISHSLGSALVFDAVSELAGAQQMSLPVPGTEEEPAREAAIQFASAATQAYMLANQLPLIELRTLRRPTGPDWLTQYPCPPADAREAGGRDTPRSGLSGFLSLRRPPSPEEADVLRPLSVVAFSDPNDLLTYFLPERFKKNCTGATFANVTVTNASKRWFWLFADPIQAHTGFDNNDRVAALLVNGRLGE